VNTSSEETPQSGFSRLRSKWLNVRRKRFWGILLLCLYTVFGFIGAPWLLKSGIIDFASSDLGREARVGTVHINPFALSLEITGLELLDKDGARLAAVDDLRANLQLSSLYRRAWTFREISLVGPYFLFERFTGGESRLSRLLADFPATDKPAPAAAESGGLPRLLVYTLAITNGKGDLRDNVPSTPFHLAPGPIDIVINELNTLPDRSGRQDVSIALPGNASLSWSGSLSLSPLESTGNLTLENSHLDQIIAYLREVYPLELIDAVLSARLDYHLSMGDDAQLELEVSGLQAELEKLSVTGLTPSENFLKVGNVSVQGGGMTLSKREIHLDRVEIRQPELLAWLGPDGVLSLNQLTAGADGEPDSADGDPTDWRLAIGEVGLNDGRLTFSDRQLEPPSTFEINHLQLTSNDISNVPEQRIPFRAAGGLAPSGAFEFEGNLALLPDLTVEAKARATDIPLPLGQPYMARMFHLQLERGSLSSAVDLRLEPEAGISVEGSLDVADLRVDDARDDSPLLGWKSLDIDRFTLTPGDSRLHVSQVAVEESYIRLAVNADRSTNLDGLQIESADADAEPVPVADEKPFKLIIGGTGLRNGSMDFSDASLPLPFATHISDLDGSFSTIATGSAEPARIQLEGQVDEYGLARIGGTINLLQPLIHTDMRVEFRNLQMSRLTPYTAEFAGREIDEGKLDLDLNYEIKQGQLVGENGVVLSDLVLGREVESKNAANLPLGLAVALLTDSNGVINIDLPVAGNVNDPEFRIGGVIWKAFTGLITKIVSAPFRLLGSLIGVDSEELGKFQFLAGRSDLTPPELEKVGQLEKALSERPDLKIEITGVYDPAIDTKALKYSRLRNTVIELLNREELDDDEEMMLDEEILEALETLFTKQFPDIPLETVEALHTRQSTDDPEAEPVRDRLAYAGDLRDRLIDAQDVTAEDLAELGRQRAETIRNAFLAGGQFGADRAIMAEPREVESEDDEWVVTELGVAAE
jgi:Fe-S-cluster formation regulator IscX/YfhJ